MLPLKRSSTYLLLSCLLVLSACSGQNLEDAFAPDPKLQEDSNSAIDSPSEPQAKRTTAELPENFPEEIPRYQKAQLQRVKSGSNAQQGELTWISTDPSNRVENYYRQALSTDGWEITEPFLPEANPGENTLVARQDNLQVRVSILSPDSDVDTAEAQTRFVVNYSREGDFADTDNQETEPTQTASAEPQEFADLEQIPPQQRQYIEDLAAVGVLTLTENESGTQQFNADEPITRREFARWLVAANNRLYANRPGEQIRLASKTSEPAFGDISKSDPDFVAIQGLAEAGIIPSPLTGDSSAVVFRPDAPLKREDLIAWKVPLDVRGGLPDASIDSVKETWGFQDSAKIEPKNLRSLYADYQSGEQANIRRVFGYTTLFQPKKPVTRAEAAAALWYFGYQGEGVSAQDALQIEEQGN